MTLGVLGSADNHLMLGRPDPYSLTGKAVEKLLDAAHITRQQEHHLAIPSLRS